MKIKSLLLGSAAALVAVSGAQAADPVTMIEAEPVEYVRVCDAYGAGFFYIPGSETCLKLSGSLRFDYTVWSDHEDGVIEDHAVGGRAALTVTAKNETEWGTLSSDFTWVSSAAAGGTVSIDGATLALAGWRIAYAGIVWNTAGGGNYNSISGGNHDAAGTAAFVDYTYTADGLTVILGANLGTGSSGGDSMGRAGQPDPYVKVALSGAMGSVYGVYQYDSDHGAGAYHIGGELDLGDFIPGGKINAFTMNDDKETHYVGGHAWGTAFTMALTDSISFNAGYTANNGWWNEGSDWVVGVKWAAAPGLAVNAEFHKDIDRGGADFIARVTRSF